MSHEEQGLQLYHTPNGNLMLNSREYQICQCLYEFNQLRAFPLTEIERLEWKDTLLKLIPDLDVMALEFAICQMILGKIEYRPDKAIRNIIDALKDLEMVNGKYQIRKYYY